jgi:DNA polymerase III epsilon subunit family exonuclease
MKTTVKSKTQTNIADTTFIVCDVETTGLSPHQGRITEISLIKIRDEEIVDKFTTLLNPRQHIPAMITRLTGITNEDVMNKPTFEETAQRIASFINDTESTCTVFVGHNASFDYSFLRESFLRMKKPPDFDLKSICTCKLARRLLPKLKSKSLGNVSEHLGINMKKKHRAYDDTIAAAKILLHFLDVLQTEYEFDTIEDVIKFQNSKIYTADRKSPALKRLKINLRDIPSSPGVYFYKSRSGEILYIGKAKNLRERVSTYFRHNDNLAYKIKRLLTYINSLEFEITDSELSALILESKMIKRHKPRFNTAIKRYRFHPFLKLDVQNEFPKVDRVYEIENDGAFYYGPFMSTGTTRHIYRQIYDNFRLRKCEDKTIKARAKSSACMYYDIGKCDAPCNLSQDRDEYRAEVDRVHNYIINSDDKSFRGAIKTMMLESSAGMDFEKAALLRDRLRDIEKVMSFRKVITSAINDKKIIIKCDTPPKREVFFIHNGKLMKTYTLRHGEDFDQRNFTEEISETTEYLYFSLNKFARHRYTAEELDEIKVISNWLALTRDRSVFLEVTDKHTKEDIVSFALQ